ncbi:EamA domain, WAT1-related protein [Tanacetum coccineum]
MKRGFRGAPRPLLPAMLLVATNPNAGQEHDAVAQSQPSSSTPLVPSTSSPQVQPTPPPIPTPTPPPIPTTSPTPIPISTPTPTPIPDTEPTPFEHIYEEPSPVHQHFSPPQEQAPSQMPMDDLLQAVPKLISRIDSLETDLKQTKLTMGNAIVKLVKKVKKLEGFLKRRNMVLLDSEEEEEELEAQGRKSQDDPLDSSEQGLVTPSTTKVKASGEEQVEDISPNTLEAAKTLSKVASLKPSSIDKGRRYKRRKEAKGKKVVSSLDFQEEVNTGAEQVNTAQGVSTGSTKLSTGSEQVSTVGDKKSTSSPDKGQRAGKAPMIIEETPKKSKEQVLQEEASLAEAIRLDTLQKEEFEAQHYTNEDWDLIRAKIEANAELSKSMLGSELQGEDFAKKMVDLVNQRKKYFAEERARAKRNKPMTQSQLKTYMMNYLKNQGTWKLSQLKNLSFEEVKKEFDKLVKQVESFAPINFEATKASLKRFGEELQTKTPKRLKDDEDVEAKDDEPTKKSGKRRKQMARKGLHTSVDKDDSEGSDEDSEQDDSVTGTKTPINPVPVAMKTPSIATYKIFKQGEKGAYQIVREDGTDVVYINFGAMLKVISRDDLTELYRIVMNRYGMDGPEDELEKVFWKYLKNMFEEPLSTDPIWSELGQQRIISWRYYESCRVHCLNLESMDVYMLIERTYPLSAEMCKAMLDKKLQGGKPDENCYKMLKMMEKQAGIRKSAKHWKVIENGLHSCCKDKRRSWMSFAVKNNLKNSVLQLAPQERETRVKSSSALLRIELILAVKVESRPATLCVVILVAAAVLELVLACPMSQNLFAQSLVLTSPTFTAAFTNLVPPITFIVAVLFRMEKVGIGKITGKAKVVGTLVAIGGAMLLTFYKGPPLNILSTHFNILHGGQRMDGHLATSHKTSSHQIMGAVLALAYSLAYSLAIALYFSLQLVSPYLKKSNWGQSFLSVHLGNRFTGSSYIDHGSCTSARAIVRFSIQPFGACVCCHSWLSSTRLTVACGNCDRVGSAKESNDSLNTATTTTLENVSMARSSFSTGNEGDDQLHIKYPRENHAEQEPVEEV